MPLWAYLLIGFVIVALVLLTFRRNTPVVHRDASRYGTDFDSVLREIEPAMERLREALRDREERPLAMAAAAARSRLHAQIQVLDRLDISTDIPDEDWEMLTRVRLKLRQAMENYEWAARIAETTELLENDGLLRAFATLAGAGDQLCAEVRFDLVGITPGAGESSPLSARPLPPG
jgi:hypothetical protein